MKISVLVVALAAVPAVSFAAPSRKPASVAPVVTPSPAKLAADRAKAVVFLDGIATSYRKLHSLSGKWHGTGGYDRVEQTWRNAYKSEGTLAWRNSKPGQVRYEDKTGQVLFVSNGVRHLIRADKSDTVEATYDNPLVEFNTMGPDEITKFFISGLNPLRSEEWGYEGAARLVGVATVKGVRCRGVEVKRHQESRDSASDHVFTMWFDSRNLMRRCQQVTSDLLDTSSKYTERVDFEWHRNVNLSPSLFEVPNLPPSDVEAEADKPASP